MLSSSGLFEETRRDYGRYKSLGHPRSEGRREESELKTSSTKLVAVSTLSRNFFFFSVPALLGSCCVPSLKISLVAVMLLLLLQGRELFL
jgi:hypothetical protein